jgi:small subunit ribosomal protein S13
MFWERSCLTANSQRLVYWVYFAHAINTPSQHALTHFYGIGTKTAARLCARLSIHDTAKVRSLTPTQITNLASFLSSPQTAPPQARLPLAPPKFTPVPASTPVQQVQQAFSALLRPVGAPSRVKYSPRGGADQLRNLKIEAELRREVRENIAHQRMIGSYVGRRHAMGIPVRGQNTRTNAKNARRFNKVDRRG